MWSVSPSRRIATKYSHETPDADVIIVGAGTTGASMAMGLAKQGKKVLVIEKCMDYQDRFVGELMQPGGLRALRSLGLIDCAETEDDIKTLGYTIISTKRKENIMLHYPKRIPQTIAEFLGFNDTNNGTAAQYGRGFHNGAFVQRIRERMLQEPNITVIEGTVIKLTSNSKTNECTGVEFRRRAPDLDTEMPTEKAAAPLVIVADGLWSGLRRELSSDSPKQISSFVAVLMTHPPNEATVPNRNFGHVILANPSPILMYQISRTDTRVLVDVPGTKVPSSSTGALTDHLINFVAPQIPEESRAAFIKAVHEGPVKSMPNREFMTTQPTLSRVILLGDSFNMRHPLT
ncbi:hypothetical protein DAPPUDRAFT_71528, partial [Daphnia pulex]